MIKWGFLILAFFPLWFTGKAAVELIEYGRLQERTPADVTRWEVEEMGGSEYALKAHYTYSVGDKEFHGAVRFKKPYFLNKKAAELAQKSWASHPWQAWYTRKDPAHSSLQKIFPLKDLVYGVLALGLVIYFLILMVRLKPGK